MLLASTGFCGRELYAIADRANHLYMVGSMGCVTPLALGLALARPDLKVIALDGDGAALMRLGALATVGATAPRNFWHLLLDNAAHESTGGQATVSATVAFADVAAACGYRSSLDTDSVAQLGAVAESGGRTAFRTVADATWDTAGSAAPQSDPGAGARAVHAAHQHRGDLMILLNPGPVTLSERVRRSLLNPDLCHREAEFFDLQDEIRAGLLAVYGLQTVTGPRY